MDRDFETLEPGSNRSARLDCPDPLRWYEIANGQLADEPTQRYLQHATDCEHCGRLLAEAVADLNDETTVDETRQISSLESARPDWRDRLARRIAGSLMSQRAQEPARISRSRFALALTALLFVTISVYYYGFRRSPEQQVGNLLSQAASERRFSEMRMEGSRYAPLGEGLTREPVSTFLNNPGELLKAEALIYDQLASHPSDSFWLRAKARADLLDGKHDAAQATLVRALQLSPKSPEILTDLAIAYYQQKNYAAAYERLSEALAVRPDDPVALFNRAVVSETQFLYRQALEDWDRYLQVDSNSEWATEARQRADVLRKKLEKHDQSRNEPLLTPAQVVELAKNSSGEARVDERVEEYLAAAVDDWLPRAYPALSSANDSAEQQALFFLADLSTRQHNDLWLSDLLRYSSSANFPSAVAALAHASRANQAGNYDVSRDQGLRAEKLFSAAGIRGGVLRAQFEQVFSAQMTRRGEACRRQSKSALSESRKYSYPWLQIQLELGQGGCSFLMGDIGSDERTAASAIDLARKSAYGALYLRAAFFAADDKHFTGDDPEAQRLAAEALESFWAGRFPIVRGYNFYWMQADIARAADRPNLQMAAWQEATGLIDSDEDVLLRAWAHRSLADAATAAGRSEIAEEHYREAGRLFALAPRTEASRNYAIETDIRIARLEARVGRFDDAIARLTSLQDQVRPLSNHFLAQMFYSTLGELQLGRHREPEAEQALRPALAFAEQSLASLKSEAERTTWSKDAAPAYLAFIEAQLAQGHSREALETYEWYLAAPQRAVSPHLRSIQSNMAMPATTMLESRLPLLTKETVLAYAVLPDGIEVWVYDDRGIDSQWIPRPTDELHELATRLHDLSSDPRSEISALRRDARSLYEALVAPVESHFTPGRTLVIETDGWLAQVPFEALLDAHQHYLIERAPIVYSSGQASEARLRSGGAISSGMPALVVGSTASSPADGLISLPDVTGEADVVSNGFRTTTVLKGGDATLNAVRRQLPAATAFHFAGHSLATQDKAGLLLAGETPTDAPLLLDAETVQRLKLPNLQLAVLSACSTGAGNGGSKGFKSITETLLRAGVPHIVASRWAVDSVEARAFVDDFYKNVLTGRSVSESTRLSSQKMLSNPHTAHPYYWSAFAAYGRP